MSDLGEDLHYLLNRAEADGGKVVSIEAVRRLLAGADPAANDIDQTGRCCCNGCIGQGLCDLATPDERQRWWPA